MRRKTESRTQPSPSPTPSPHLHAPPPPDTLVKTPSLAISPARRNSKGRNNRTAVCNAPLRSSDRPSVRPWRFSLALHVPSRVSPRSRSLFVFIFSHLFFSFLFLFFSHFSFSRFASLGKACARMRSARAIAADKLADGTAPRSRFALLLAVSRVFLSFARFGEQTISFNGLCDLARGPSSLSL